MKKFIASMLAGIMMIFGVGTMSGCSFIEEVLDNAVDIELLEDEIEALEEENKTLKEQLATLKFELAFPNGLVTESCILNNVKVVRDTVNVDGSVYAVRADGEGVEVTINGGYYDAGSGSLYNIAVWAHNGSKVVINGGTFVTGNDVNDELNHCIYAAGGSIIEINGGTFMSSGDASWLLNCQDNNGTIIVKGGTFVGFNPKDCVSEGEHTSFLAEGYDVIEETIDNVDYYTVVAVVEESIPEVEEQSPETPDEF